MPAGLFQATIRFGRGSDTVWSGRPRHELEQHQTMPLDGYCFKHSGKVDERFLTRHDGVRVKPSAKMVGVYKAPGAVPHKWMDATVPTAADWTDGLHFSDLWFEVKKENPVPSLDPAVEERRTVSASVYNIATGTRCGWAHYWQRITKAVKWRALDALTPITLPFGPARGWLSCKDGVWAVCARPGAHIWGLRPRFKALLWVRTRSTYTYVPVHVRELNPQLREEIRVDLGMLS